MQGRHAPGLVVRTPGRLAVRGHNLVLQRRGRRLHPRGKAGFQPGRIQQAEDAPEGVVREDAVRQVQEGFQPGLLLETEQLDLDSVVGTADDGQGGDQENGLQGMSPGLGTTGIVDLGQQRHQGDGVRSAMSGTPGRKEAPTLPRTGAIQSGMRLL